MACFSNKTDLDKKNVKILRSYSRYFDLKQPYKVIIGPYFCQIVAEKRISLQDGIESVFLQRECELFTTRCCINDLQKLIDKKQTKFIRGAHILRTLQLLPCLHKNKSLDTNNTNNNNKKKANRWKCIDSIHCIQFYVNTGRYCFALQPRSFLGRIRSKPGIPSIWMYQSTMILDKLSKASQTFIEENRNLSKDDIKQNLEINKFIHDDDIDNDSNDDDDDDDIDLNYNINHELQLDDMQNNEEDIYKNDSKQKQNGNTSKHGRNTRYKQKKDRNGEKKRLNKEYSRNRYRFSRENRIRYGPDGGFDTMGMRVSSRKKRRTKRGNKKQRKNEEDVQHENLNDNSFELEDNDKDVMTITNPQKSMSNWWKQ